MNEKESIAKEAREYEDLENLTKQPGWKVLLKHLDKVNSLVMKALLKEKDYNNILTLQERHRAFSSVIQTLESAKMIKEKLYKDLMDIMEDEKLRKEFDI